MPIIRGMLLRLTDDTGHPMLLDPGAAHDLCRVKIGPALGFVNGHWAHHEASIPDLTAVTRVSMEGH